MQTYDMERRFKEVFDSCNNLGDIFTAMQIFNHCLLSRITKVEISRRDSKTAQAIADQNYDEDN